MSPEELCKYIERRGNGANLAEQFDREKESLLSWGQKNGILYSKETFSKRKVGEEQYFGGGNEHDVYYDEELGRVVKVTKTTNQTDLRAVNNHWNFGAQGSLIAYLTNLLNHNVYFGDDIKIEGVLEMGNLISVISSQPFISGRKASEKEITSWFSSLGFEEGERPHTFTKATDSQNLLIFDARPDNVIRSFSGEIIPIDLQILVKDKAETNS